MNGNRRTEIGDTLNTLASEDLERHQNGRVYRMFFDFQNNESGVKNNGKYVFHTTSQEVLLRLALFSERTQSTFIQWLEEVVFAAGQIENKISFIERELDENGNVLSEHSKHIYMIRTAIDSVVHYNLSPAK